MLDYVTLGRLIQEERRREIENAARARLVPPANQKHSTSGRSARRGVGRMLVRFGVWLAMLETTAEY